MTPSCKTFQCHLTAQNNYLALQASAELGTSLSLSPLSCALQPHWFPFRFSSMLSFTIGSLCVLHSSFGFQLKHQLLGEQGSGTISLSFCYIFSQDIILSFFFSMTCQSSFIIFISVIIQSVSIINQNSFMELTICIPRAQLVLIK